MATKGNSASDKRAARRVDPIHTTIVENKKSTKRTKKVASSVDTVSGKIASIAKKAAKDIKQVALDAGADNIAAVKGKEWRTTEKFRGLLETNGLGEFRNVVTGDLIQLKPRSQKRQKIARTVTLKDINGVTKTISLQKFVALIYHSNLNGAIATKVLDGNRDNLSRENVAWSLEGDYKY